MKNKLKVIRAQKRLTQEQLAGMAGISRPALVLIENEKSVPDGETIKKLSKALNIPAGDIFEDLSRADELKDCQLREEKRNADIVKNAHITACDPKLFNDKLAEIISMFQSSNLRCEVLYQTSVIDNYVEYSALCIGRKCV